MRELEFWREEFHRLGQLLGGQGKPMVGETRWPLVRVEHTFEEYDSSGKSGWIAYSCVNGGTWGDHAETAEAALQSVRAKLYEVIRKRVAYMKQSADERATELATLEKFLADLDTPRDRYFSDYVARHQ